MSEAHDGLLRIAVLGLGEAGSLLARDLQSGGAHVCGWDPAPHANVDGITLADSLAGAVASASVVISVNWASVAADVARAAAATLQPGCLFADHNTAGPALKIEVARIVEAAGGRFADVAMMAPVPGVGMRVPMFISGECAGELAALYRRFGSPVEVVGPLPGDAAARKLTRSVFFKGLSAAVCEALDAARAAGVEDWLRADITRTLRAADDGLLERIVSGTYRHARRRAHEMHAAVALLAELGVPSTMSAAAAASLERIAERIADAVRTREELAHDAAAGSGAGIDERVFTGRHLHVS